MRVSGSDADERTEAGAANKSGAGGQGAQCGREKADGGDGRRGHRRQLTAVAEAAMDGKVLVQRKGAAERCSGKVQREGAERCGAERCRSDRWNYDRWICR